jgi:hypothetical protein
VGCAPLTDWVRFNDNWYLVPDETVVRKYGNPTGTGVARFAEVFGGCRPLLRAGCRVLTKSFLSSSNFSYVACAPTTEVGAITPQPHPTKTATPPRRQDAIGSAVASRVCPTSQA